MNIIEPSSPQQVDLGKASILLVDLDETVYPSSCEVWPLVRERLNTYLRDRLGFEPAVIPALRERLFLTYGTTLRGLQVEFSVDTDDYLEFVHDIQVEKYMQPDRDLYNTLQALPQPKYIFTNASRDHANRVLSALEISKFFFRIIDIQDIAPYCKPYPETYRIAMQIIGEVDPGKYLFIDDAPRNLYTARDLGMQVLQVSEKPEGGLPSIPRLADLITLCNNL